MHLLFARGLGHLVVIPFGGLLAMMWAHLPVTWMVAIDVTLVILLEMALVGGPVALAVGLKSLVPAVAGALILPRILPRPTTTAVVFSVLIVAATAAGLVWYLYRGSRMPRRTVVGATTWIGSPTGGLIQQTRILVGDGRNTWNRTIASLVCLAVASTIEVSVAGLALTMGGLEPGHIAAAFIPAPLFLAAVRLQNPRPMAARRWVADLATRLTDIPGRIRLVAGAR